MTEFLVLENIKINILNNKLSFEKDKKYIIEDTLINIFFISQWQKENKIKIILPKAAINVAAGLGKTVGKGRVF